MAIPLLQQSLLTTLRIQVSRAAANRMIQAVFRPLKAAHWIDALVLHIPGRPV